MAKSRTQEIFSKPVGEINVTRNLQKYARQTNIRLIAGALVLLFIVGDGLIYLFYGSSAAAMGFLCLLVGMIPVVLVVLIILLLDWITKRANRD
jgi:magnesium-transporting ATPase (P-type)